MKRKSKQRVRINNEWIIRQMQRYLRATFPSVNGLVEDLTSVGAEFGKYQELKITCPPLGKPPATPNDRGGKGGGSGGGTEHYKPERMPHRNRDKIIAGAPAFDEPGVTWKTLARLCGCQPNTNFREALKSLVREEKIDRDRGLYKLAEPKK